MIVLLKMQICVKLPVTCNDIVDKSTSDEFIIAQIEADDKRFLRISGEFLKKIF